MSRVSATQTQHDRRLEVLTAFSDAWTNADIDQLMSMVSDDCVYAASVGPEPGATYRGRAEVHEGFLAVLAHDSGRTRAAGPVHLFGDHAVAEWSFAETRADGTEVLIRGCDIFDFDGELISRKDAFRKTYDRPEA